MHPQRVTGWCGFWNGDIIGPFFYENEQGAGHLGQWRALPCHAERIFVSKN